METTKVMTLASRKAGKGSPPPDFTKKVIDYLRSEGREVSFPAGGTVIRRGDPGTAFYVILSGEVEVRLVGEDHHCLTLARLGPGAGFGEMSLLRGEPASADIMTVTPVTLLQCSAPFFRRAMAESEAFRSQLTTRMADNLANASSEAWAFHQRAEAFNMLVRSDGRQEEPLAAKSVKMKVVEKRICELARTSAPVLVTGEPGTGKLFAARKIHNLWAPADAPHIVTNCIRLCEIEASTLLFGSSRPRESGECPEGFGALHLAHGGMLVLQNIDRLDPAAQEYLSCYLNLHEFSGEGVFPHVKVIATTRENPAELLKSGRLSQALYDYFAGNTLRMPPLKDRKADVIPLAQIFLKAREEQPDQPEKQLSEHAEHALLAQRYRHNNVSELREAVEMAALFSMEGEIRPEHIFTGPKDKGLPPEYDLGKIPVVRGVVNGKGHALRAIRYGMLGMFAAIILLCLLAGGSAAGQTANALIWAVWEPALIFLFLFLGHVWCAVCPLSTAARTVRRLGSMQRPIPQWIKKYGVWLSVAGLFLILWSERVFHMTARPAASGVLLLTLIAGAVLVGVLYRREAWCRYICPLGALASVYSLPAALHVRALPQICSTYCTTHECYKGNADTPGCPVFHHPLYAADGHNCKLCLQCLKTCPHGSVKLYLRPFLQPVWLFGGFAAALTPFALAVYALSIIMLAAGGSVWLRDPLILTATALAAVLAGIALNALLPRLLYGEHRRGGVTASRTAFALLLTAWGPLMAYQLANIPGLTSVRLYVNKSAFLSGLLPAGGLTLLTVMQLSVILLALLFSAVAFQRIRVHAAKEGTKIKRTGWNVLLSFNAVYVVFAVIVTLM